jgi:cytochrome c biogenesis protein CcmG/thiol:disulfide interchange protein DsbE
VKKLAAIVLTALMVGSVAQAEGFDISTYKGKVVYLDFWASWCGPCKESFPWLNELSQKYPNLKVIAINLDKNKEDADEFLKKYPAKFEVQFDSSAKSAERYKVRGMPYSVIFDKDGKEVHSHIGFSKEKANEYLVQIKTLLGEK